jgi:hypothetical protein
VSRSPSILRVSVGLGAAALLAVAAVLATSPPLPTPREVDWASYAAGPTDKLAVYWVGHSLMNASDGRVEGSRNLIERVGDFAASQGLAYEGFDNTIYGACLSMLWRGVPHLHERRVPEMLERLRTLFEHGERFDALVMTEGVPLEGAMLYEHSTYYAQEFYGALLERNPAARVYLYECWSNLQASDAGRFYPRPSAYDWSARLAEDRKRWEQLADLASTGAVPAPGLRARLAGWFGADERVPAKGAPIFLVPVGTVFRALAQLAPDARPRFEGRALALADLFSNAYTDWPSDWPLASALPAAEEQAQLAKLSLRHPGEALDDIHPSDLGVYIASLTHFATLYRRTPVGLPASVAGLDEENARRLQEFVWELVRRDPRTGVMAR